MGLLNKLGNPFGRIPNPFTRPSSKPLPNQPALPASPGANGSVQNTRPNPQTKGAGRFFNGNPPSGGPSLSHVNPDPAAAGNRPTFTNTGATFDGMGLHDRPGGQLSLRPAALDGVPVPPPPPKPGDVTPAFSTDVPAPAPKWRPDYSAGFDTHATTGHNKWYKPSVDTWQRQGPQQPDPNRQWTTQSARPDQPGPSSFDSMGLRPGKVDQLTTPPGFVPPPRPGTHPPVVPLANPLGEGSQPHGLPSIPE